MVLFDISDLHEGEVELWDYLSEDDEETVEMINQKLAVVDNIITTGDNFPNVVIVAGAPKVGQERYDKLVRVMDKKITEKLVERGVELSPSGFKIELPMENGSTTGSCFLIFETPYEAREAAKYLNGFHLDIKHPFHAVLLDEFDSLMVEEKDVANPPFRGFTREGLKWWYADTRFREQFALRYADETEIKWHDPLEAEPVMIYNGERETAEGKRVWTDFRVDWSPRGSYFATFHKPGIVLWAEKSFEKKMRFEHKDVKSIEFSPDEQFLVTWNGSPPAAKSPNAYRIWQVLTGQLLREFPTPTISPRGTEFPHFLWSHDDKFIAHCSDKELYIYSTPSISLIQDTVTTKRLPIRYPLSNFDWSPGENMLSVWIPEQGDSPGRLLLISVPSREEVASKNVYNVREASMRWQSRGDYLCLRAVVARKTGKKGRKEYTQLEIFRIREKNIPVDTVAICDVVVKQLHWEEASARFAIILEDEASHAQSVRFYRVSQEGARRDTECVDSYDMAPGINCMKWSPFGTYFVLGALGTDGSLLFCSLNEFDKFDILQKDEHYMVTDISWSRCGRFVATSVTTPMAGSAGSSTAWRYDMEAGYTIWSFQGKQQYKTMLKKLYQFKWRPRPLCLLSESKVEDIQKHLRDYSKKYDMLDENQKTAMKELYRSQRKAETDAFDSFLADLKDWHHTHHMHNEWTEAWNQFSNQFEWDDIVETSEQVLSVQESVV